VDFLLVLIELFSLGVTADSLLVKINRKLKAGVSVWVNFQAEGDAPPPTIFAVIVRPINAIQLCR